MDTDMCESRPLSLPPEEEKLSALRRARHEASDTLHRPGVLATMMASFLFCLLLIFTLVAVLQLLNALASLGSSVPRFAALWPLWEVLYWLITVAAVLLCILPVWLGRLRISGLLLAGEMPAISELFYWFSTQRRYGRALRISLIISLQIALPVTACGLLVKGSFAFYEALSDARQYGIAVGVLITGLMLSVVLAVLLLFWSGLWLTFGAVAVGNESLSLRDAMRVSLRGGRNLNVILGFSLISLKDLLLSLLSVGILFVLRYTHLYTLTYLRLSQALCPKGETPL